MLGSHEGEWRGIPATGRRFEDIDEIYLFKVEQGELDSALAVVEDNLARMRQLGLDARGYARTRCGCSST